MTLKFDLDPSVPRVVVVAVLEFCYALLGGILVILQEGNFPTPLQFTTIITIAMLSLVTFLLTFVKGETVEKE